MAHEPCEEASGPKHGKKNIAWCGVDGELAGPGSFISTVTFQVASKLQA
jgi:hypothetical protein